MHGIRILDLTRVLAGPWATQQLADQGAEVVKVEPPGGDETRRFGPIVGGVSTYFTALNRNKRSIVLDLRTESGQGVGRRLAARSDVLVENFRPGVAARLGLGWETLRALNPRLVYVAIHAFGDDGDPAWTQRAGYDLVLQAMGGAMSAEEGTGRPLRAGAPVADLNAAQLCVQAVLMGLLHRERTGEGQKIVVNMMQAQAAALTYLATRYTLAGDGEVQRGNAHRGLVPYDLYRCQDGWLAIACGNDGIWQRLRQALGVPDREDWRTNLGRVQARAAVDGAIEDVLAGLTVAAAEARLAAAGVPTGPVLDVAGALAHPQVRTVDVVDPELGALTLPAPPLQTATTRDQHQAPPRLDADRERILEELGYTGPEVQALVTAGAFGPR